MQTYHIEGLSCAACAISSQKILSKTAGVSLARVNFASKTALVEFEPDQHLSIEVLNQRLQKLGYQLFPKDKAHQSQRKLAQTLRLQQFHIHLWISLIFGIPLIIIGMFLHHQAWAGWAMFALSTPILFIAGFPFFRNAIQQARYLQSNMDTLVALGTGISYLFSVFNLLFPSVLQQYGLEAHLYFETAGGLLTFILIGKYLEEKAKQGTSQAIEQLLDLQATNVHLYIKEELKIVPIEAIQLEDIILIKAGERVPLDGIIIDGKSELDESALTGESIPVAKKKGDTVWAGTMNQLGTIQLRVNKLPEDTVLAQIIRLVEQAQASQAPVQQLVDKVSAIFVPMVVLFSILTFGVWLIFGTAAQAILSAITVLVVACPCALGLATPTAIMVGIGQAAKSGILLKGASSLELAKHINTIILDKTGTLTEGKPFVVAQYWTNKNLMLEQSNVQQLLYTNLVFSMESNSSHPLARGIMLLIHQARFLRNEEATTILPIQNVQTHIGKGISAEWEGITYLLGNASFLQDNHIEIPTEAQTWIQEQGATTVFFATAQGIISIYALRDKLRPTTQAAIDKFHSLGIETYLCTGDTLQSAQSIAHQLNIKHIYAKVLPQDKIQLVKDLQTQGKNVAMVGDGINDAPALAQANLGIAMNNGTDIAVESASVVLLKNDLLGVVRAIQLSRSTVSVIRQNLFWAFIYNILMLPLAAGALYPIFGLVMHPMLAGGAMAISSVSVVLNSLRLKWM